MAINDDIIIGIVFLIILFFLERKEADVKFYKNLEIRVCQMRAVQGLLRRFNAAEQKHISSNISWRNRWRKS